MQNFLNSLNEEMLKDEKAFLISFGTALDAYNGNLVKELKEGGSLEEIKHKGDEDYIHFKDSIREFMQNTIGNTQPKKYEGLCMKVKVVALTKQRILFADLENK